MEKTYDKFQVMLLSEVKGKDKNAFIFELRLTSEDNCRIRITDFEAFDIDGNKYCAEQEDISTTDVILGHSKFFTETKKVTVKISPLFKAKIGCMAVLTAACIEDKQKMSFCFQRKGTNRWDCVGIQFMEYEGVITEIQEPESEPESAAEPVVEILEESGAALFAQQLEQKGLETYRSASMKELLDDYGLWEQTLGDFLSIFKELYFAACDQERAAVLEEAAAAVEAVEEEESTESIEEFLNSLIEFDEKSAETIGLAVKHMRIRVEEKDDVITPILYCEVSYSKETYVLVRCPMIKVIFYDEKGNIANVAMHSVSRIHTGEDIVEMAFKKSTLKYWKNKSKIKILVTI